MRMDDGSWFWTAAEGQFRWLGLNARGLEVEIEDVTDAIAAVGTARASIRFYLSEVGGDYPAFEGVTGTIAFDENGDVPDKDVAIGVVRGNSLVPATP